MKKILFICSLLLAGAAWAHGDDEHKDHAHASPSAVLETNAAVPALTTQSEIFELVARLYENELGLYIDYWKSNAPVLNAKVEVELNGRKVPATFHADHGDYAVSDPEMLKALHAEGEHALVFTIVAGPPQDDGLLHGGKRVKDSPGGNPVAGKDVDLLTGELHTHAESPLTTITGGRNILLLVVVAAVLLIGCGLALRHLLQARKDNL